MALGLALGCSDALTVQPAPDLAETGTGLPPTTSTDAGPNDKDASAPAEPAGPGTTGDDAGTPPSKAIVAYTGSSAKPSPNSGNGLHDIGHQFDVTEDGITVTELGVWDANADGLAAPHTVTLFSLDRTGAGAKATPVPGGSVTVPAGTSAPLADGHRFASLATPIELASGHYAVIAFGLNEADPYGDGGNVPLSTTGIIDQRFDPQNDVSKPSAPYPNTGDGNPHAGASFRYRGAHTSFIKIMPLGASITEGWASSNTVAGYRGYLHALLEQDGIAHQFVGSSTSHPGLLPREQLHHEGHPGYMIQAAAGSDGIVDHFDAWLGPTGVTPDFILVLVGSNDVAKNYDFANIGARMDGLIARISNPQTGLAPKARLIIATIPRINDAAQEKRAVTYNKIIVDVVKAHADKGENVRTIDAHGVIGPADKADNLHPNDKGYEKLAPLWRDAILAP